MSNIAGQRLVLELRIINARSEELTSGRMGQMIDREMAKFTSIIAIGRTEDEVDVELKDMVGESSKKATDSMTETPPPQNPAGPVIK